MSRIGRAPVVIPEGVECRLEGNVFHAKGKKGQLSLTLPQVLKAELEGGKVSLSVLNEEAFSRALWGTFRSHVANAVKGVSEGFRQVLDIEGVGYRAAVAGNTLKMALGYSHDVDFPIPQDVQIVCEKPTTIVVSGADRQRVGQIAAEIQSFRPPEPYKGKGIKKGEGLKPVRPLRRKQGKKK